MTELHRVVCYMSDSDFTFVKHLALKHHMSVSAVMSSLICYYRTEKYYNHDDFSYDLKLRCWKR